MIISLIVSAIVLGSATHLVIELAIWLASKKGRVSKADPETMKLMRALFPIATGVVGAMLASYDAYWATFATVGLVCAALAMATWSEVCYGVVDDLILLIPLAILILVAVTQREYGQLAAAALLAVPFGVLALMSHGKGVARTDIELAALGGALLGFKFGIIAFFLALVAAFVINYQRRGDKQPVELTPYLCSSIIVAVLVRLVLPADISG